METNSPNRVLNQLIFILQDECGVDGSTVSPETEVDGLGIDSLDFLCVLNRIRDEIGPIETRVAAGSRTVGELASAIG